MRFLIKTLVTALVVAGVSELGKRTTFLAAILASLPLTSILAILWVYQDTSDVSKIVDLSYGIFWAVLPSLLFFLVLPFLLKRSLPFSVSMIASCAIMAAAYWVYVTALGKA